MSRLSCLIDSFYLFLGLYLVVIVIDKKLNFKQKDTYYPQIYAKINKK